MPDEKYNDYGYTPKMPQVCDVPALGNQASYDSEDDGISQDDEIYQTKEEIN